MKFIAIASLVASALAVSIDRLEKRDSLLAVTIESVGNSAVKASVTNTGTSAVKVFKSGSIFDSVPVEKTQVFSGGEKISTLYLSNSIPMAPFLPLNLVLKECLLHTYQVIR